MYFPSNLFNELVSNLALKKPAVLGRAPPRCSNGIAKVDNNFETPNFFQKKFIFFSLFLSFRGARTGYSGMVFNTIYCRTASFAKKHSSAEIIIFVTDKTTFNMKKTLIYILAIIGLLFADNSAVSAKSKKQEEPKPQIESQWNGRKVAFLGDSITDKRQITDSLNDIYWHQLEQILGIRPYVYGTSGSQWTEVIPQAERMEKELGQDVDAIFVFMGTNDYNASFPIGEWYTISKKIVQISGPATTPRAHREFYYGEDTFRGRINKGLFYLKSHYPTKQIILLTPLHREEFRANPKNEAPGEECSNAIGIFLDEYVNTVKEAGNVWSVPVIDLYSLSGLMPKVNEMRPYFRKTVKGRDPEEFWDYLHPGTEGHLRMAYTIAYQLLALPATF